MKYSTNVRMWSRCAKCGGLLSSTPDKPGTVKIGAVAVRSAQVDHTGEECESWTNPLTRPDCLPGSDAWFEGLPN